MDIDLHCHAKLSKKSQFSRSNFNNLIRAALRSGFHAIAVTEHFNTSGFEKIYELMDSYPYIDDHYIIDGLKVFCGMEVDIKEGGHVAIIGKRDDVSSLHNVLSPNLNKENYPSIDYLIKEAKKRNMIMIGAHSYRNNKSLSNLPDDILKQLDFLELNGKDYKKSHMVMRLAQSLNMKVTAGSDTHYWLQMGCIRNRLNAEANTIEELRKALSKSNTIIISPVIGLKVKAAAAVKKIMKQFQRVSF
ncbi:phosphatase YcdX [Oxobacter pfennigii]|uniref:Phosphatase YcdX n=1 Tax=Oxobacter pfennigii TaxID=36849 RepID=A0A0P8Y7D5_9CLOT|nr:PHP domain-containing protein [Oxobacter pfennigii]KPU42383.1 phosphatase YcdX [Oxobacter pfennigii]